MKPKVRLYGAGVGHGSWSRVTEGLRRGLEHFGLVAGVHYYDSDEEQRLGDEPVAIYVGHPAGWSRMVEYGSHRHRLVVLAPNSFWLPPALVDALWQHATGILAPSTWAATVLRTHFAEAGFVRVVHHGVDMDFGLRPHPPVQKLHGYDAPFRVLHMTSSARQRKGTGELIEAWRSFRKRYPNAELHIVADWADAADDAIDDKSIRVLPRVELTPMAMAAFYQSFDCVCQPSRTEGFGMVPLESLASGVPVAVTACTGHLDHVGLGELRPAIARIAVGDDAPIDDGPGAMAPSVEPDSIRAALESIIDQRLLARRDAVEGRGVIAFRWAWPYALWRSGLIRWIEEQ